MDNTNANDGNTQQERTRRPGRIMQFLRNFNVLNSQTRRQRQGPQQQPAHAPDSSAASTSTSAAAEGVELHHDVMPPSEVAVPSVNESTISLNNIDDEVPALQTFAEVLGNTTAPVAAAHPPSTTQMEVDDDDGMPGLLDVSDSEDEDMPGLMDVSDSDDDSDDAEEFTDYEDEVERIVLDASSASSVGQSTGGGAQPSSSRPRTTVEDDLEDDSDQMPPLEAVRHRSRRARVEDDDDDNRARSRNINTSTPSSSSSSNAQGEGRPIRPLPRSGPAPLRTPQVNPLFTPGGLQPLSENANQVFRDLFRTMLNNPAVAQAAQGQPGAPAPGFAPVPPQPTGPAPTQNPRTGARQDFVFNFPGGPEDNQRRAELDEFLNALGDGNGEEGELSFMSLLRAMVGNALGMMPENEKEDPERAKKLISGLEVVPHGLVKRLERVGDKSGEGSSCGDASCAVCWDSLLNPDTDGFGTDDVKKEESTQAPETLASTSETQAVPVVVPVTIGVPEDVKAPAESSTSAQKDGEETGEKPKIVALPCSHVFHAACLQPWFSRPGQTTCPTCRFNIDPENLTYTPRPIERPPRQRRPFGPPTAAEAAARGQTAGAAQNNRQPTAQPAVPDASNNATPPVQGPAPPPASQTNGGNGAGNRPRRQRPVSGTAVFTFGLPGGREGTTMMNFGFGYDGSLGGGNANGGMAGGAMPNFANIPGMRGMNEEDYETVFEGGWTFTVPHFPLGAMPGMPGAPGLPRANRQPRERKVWTIPPAPGLTLRQRIEKMERDAGLRCWDVSCGVGPTDDDPIPELSSPDATKQIAIQRDGDESKVPICEHRFHPSCLVSAERVAGWGAGDVGAEVEVACPVCRHTGHVQGLEWEEGVRLSSIV